MKIKLDFDIPIIAKGIKNECGIYKGIEYNVEDILKVNHSRLVCIREGEDIVGKPIDLFKFYLYGEEIDIAESTCFNDCLPLISPIIKFVKGME